MRSKKSKISTILLSGGIDSAACTHFLLSQAFNVSGIFVDYGQRAKRYEEKSAKKICNFYKIGLNICNVSSGNVFEAGEIIGRNAFLIFLALMFSKQTQGIIAIGIHSGIPYYDCSNEFFKKANTIVKNYSSGRISLLAPFLDWTKSDIIHYCKNSKVPIDLTYSCESGSLPACGKCNSCKDRNLLVC